MAHRRLTQSAPSYVSEREADESDLAKLERQFRIMDRDGKTYNRQAREQIHKQQQEIDRLRKEQEELHRNLGICKNFSHLHRDNEDTKSLRALLDEEDVIDASLIKEKEHQQVLDKEITDMQMKIANIRKEKTCINETQTSEKGQTQRAIRTLEIKLDRALTHFSEQLTKNSELRKELQTLHVEQIRFQQLRNRLEKELHDLHKKISGAVNCSIAAYDDRAEAQSKMILLKEKARKDLTQYKAEIKDLERLIAHECNLKEFMTTKCNERSVRDQWSKMKEQRIDSREESHDALEEVFSKIQTITGEDNLDLLVTRFIQVEDQKFALFNFVNDQNNEADVLKEQISQIQAEIQHFTDKSLQNEKDHGSFLADIEEKQIKLQSQTENYDKQAVSIDNILGSVKAVISRFFSKMEWDCSTKEDSLGSTMGLAENIMSHLGLTEDKTTELLSIQAFLNSKNADRNKPKEFAKFLLSQNTEQLQQPISFQPAVNSAEYEPDEAPLTDEEEWPISQEELRKKISKQVFSCHHVSQA
ncbi:coiled-coil domain-containing protein 63-like isoform X1 [Takifugu rubripes]|uniref:Outer dynein arm docking complex subunit 1 n=2 Tax=Takifugu rubripes TaxID=31033 RepID=H2UN79_TAKRU|nr:coiled-coil domain-containing protein 63-like isoform X1 [Takifugu rubripes]XP_029682475.1 coiled-coil domain-containing protein 63-like isoform X1 [Takifugu rubripes]XP_029682476.1 coiled-coil domain-containing protein 63-like isoform X1 [Takifugu rubripes]XP_029682477.1 coiled-coil domain-containing protein 63-like isoform X1 [Takifugu rubripes]